MATQEQVLSPEIIDFAHKYFRKIKIKYGKYQYTGGGRGLHKPSVFLGELKRRMIEERVSRAVAAGATDVYRSMSSRSVYYTLNGVLHRVSDHPAHPEFQGITTLITLP